MSEEVTIGRRFSLVVPKGVRRAVRLREGQKAIVRAEGEQIIVEPLPEDPYKVLAETLDNLRYSEARYEKKAEDWLNRVAHSRHRSSLRS